MKKFFLGTLAVVAMVSCAKEEILRQQTPNAIAFQNAYVENAAVRAGENPSLTTDNLEAFDVWGFMDANSGVIFNQERVTRGTDKWTYTNTQYWTPSHKYWFAALAPVDHANVEVTLAADPYMVEAGLGQVTFSNIDGTDDVIYAEATAETPAEITSTPAPVKLGFSHLLSKLRFSFKNGFTNDNAYLLVENVKIVVPGKGSIDLTQDAYTWTLDETAADVTLDLGNVNGAAKFGINEVAVSDNHRLTIPAGAAEEYAVSFKVTLYMGDVIAGSWDKTTTVTGCELVAGKQYNFRATLTANNVAENALYPIEFSAEVDEWETEYVHDSGVIETTEPTVVTNFEELKAACANAEVEDIVVAGQIDADNELVRIPTGKKLTIVGQDATASLNVPFMVTGQLTLKDIIVEGIDGNVAGQVSQFSKTNLSCQSSGDIVCENVTFNLGALQDATAITAWWSTEDGANITVRNCTFNCAGQRPIRSDACVTVEDCTFNDPYRYAVQMTSKSSTMAADAVAYVNFYRNTIVAGSTSSKPVYGVQLEGGYGCANLTINGAGNVIDLNNTGKASAMYYCECGAVDHDSIVWNTEVKPVHADFVLVETAEELTAAATNATADTEIRIVADITGDATVEQKEGVNLVVLGQGHKYVGTIYLDGNSRHTGAETLVIKDLNFELAAGDCVSCNSTNGAVRYAHNVTLEGCSFTATGEGDVVGARYRQCYNMSIVNCTATGLHSLIQATGLTGVTIDGVNVDGQSGLALGNAKNAAVKNSTIVAAKNHGYGIRVDANAANELTAENNTITAGAPILLRKATADYTANLSGNTLTTTETYQIVVCANDYDFGVALEAATGNVTLNGADGYTIFK